MQHKTIKENTELLSKMHLRIKELKALVDKDTPKNETAFNSFDEEKSIQFFNRWKERIRAEENYLSEMEQSLGISRISSSHEGKEERKAEPFSPENLSPDLKTMLANYYRLLLLSYTLYWTPLKNFPSIPYPFEQFLRDERVWLQYEKRCFSLTTDVKKKKEDLLYFKKIREGNREWDTDDEKHIGFFAELERERKLYPGIDSKIENGNDELNKDNGESFERAWWHFTDGLGVYERLKEKYDELFLSTGSYNEQVGESMAHRYRWLKVGLVKVYLKLGQYSDAREICEELVEKKLFDSDFFDNYILLCKATRELELIPSIQAVQAGYNKWDQTHAFEGTFGYEKEISDLQNKMKEVAELRPAKEQAMRVLSYPKGSPESRFVARTFSQNDEKTAKRILKRRIEEARKTLGYSNPKNSSDQIDLTEGRKSSNDTNPQNTSSQIDLTDDQIDLTNDGEENSTEVETIKKRKIDSTYPSTSSSYSTSSSSSRMFQATSSLSPAPEKSSKEMPETQEENQEPQPTKNNSSSSHLSILL